MRTKRIAARLLTLLALVAPAQALATDPEKAPTASPEYDRGYEAILAKNWTKAYEIFSELWVHPKSSDPEFEVALNLGQAELKLGKYRDAAEHLSIGILMTPADDTGTKERAGKGLAYAKKQIGTLVVVAPDGTELAINGKTFGIAPIATEVYVEPGITKVTGKHPTKGTGEAELEVKAADERKIELQLHAETKSTTAASLTPPYSSAALNQPKNTTPAPIPTNPPPPVERRSGIETKTIVLIAGGVVTLAAAGTATYFGLKAKAAKKDAQSMLKDAENQFGSHRCSSADAQGSQLCADIDGKSDARTDAAAIYNVALPIAGAAALATGLLYVFWPRQRMTTSHTFTLVPVADQRTGGVLLWGKF